MGKKNDNIQQSMRSRMIPAALVGVAASGAVLGGNSTTLLAYEDSGEVSVLEPTEVDSVESAENALNKAEEKEIELEKEIDTIKVNFEKNEATIEEAKKNLNDSTEKLEKVEDELSKEIDKMKEKAQEDLDEVNKEMLEKTNLISEKNSELNVLKEEKEKASLELKVAEEYYNNIKSETDTSNLDKAREEVEAVESEKTSKSTEVNLLKSQLEDSNKKLEETEENKKAKENEVSSIEKEISLRENDKEDLDSKIEKSKEEYDRTISEIEEMKSSDGKESITVENELKEIISEKEKQVEKISEVRSEIIEKRNEKEKVSLDVKELDRKINLVGAIVTETEKEVELAKFNVSNEEKEIEVVSNEKASADRSVTELIDARNSIEKELEDINSEIIRKQSEIISLESQPIEVSSKITHKTSIDYFKWVIEQEDTPEPVKEAAKDAIELFNKRSWLKNAQGKVNGSKYNFLENYTDFEDENDATSLENMKKALEEVVYKINQIRAGKDPKRGEDSNFGKQEELYVNDLLMAVAQLRANASSIWADHVRSIKPRTDPSVSDWANVGENYASTFDAYRSDKPGWFYTSGNPEDFISDGEMALEGWYDEEKAAYERKQRGEEPLPGDQTGHYVNVMKKTYVATGAAVTTNSENDREISTENESWYRNSHFIQVFVSASHRHKAAFESYEDYYARFMKYYNSVKNGTESNSHTNDNLKKAREELAAMQARKEIKENQLSKANYELQIRNQREISKRKEQELALKNFKLIELKKALESIESELLLHKEEVNNLKTEKENKLNTINEIEKEAEKLEIKKNKEDNALETINSNILKKQVELRSINEAYSKAVEHSEVLKSTYNSLIEDKANVDSEISRLEASKEAAIKAIEKLTLESEVISREIEFVNSEIVKKEEEIVMLDRKIEEKSIEIAKLEESASLYIKAENNVKESKKKLLESSSKIDRIIKDIELLDYELTITSMDRNNLFALNDKVKNITLENAKDYSNEFSNLSKYTKEIDKLSSTIESSKHKIEDATKENEELSSVLKVKETDLLTVKDDVKKIKEIHSKLIEERRGLLDKKSDKQAVRNVDNEDKNTSISTEIEKSVFDDVKPLESKEDEKSIVDTVVMEVNAEEIKEDSSIKTSISDKKKKENVEKEPKENPAKKTKKKTFVKPESVTMEQMKDSEMKEKKKNKTATNILKGAVATTIIGGAAYGYNKIKKDEEVI